MVKTKDGINLIEDLMDFFDDNSIVLLAFRLLLCDFFLVLKSFLK